jgi:hypothetical protein
MYNTRNDSQLEQEIELLFGPRQPNLKINTVVGQKLTIYDSSIGGRRGMQFQFYTGTDPKTRMRVILNAQQGNTGGIQTHALNRWAEEIQALMRNTKNGRVYKTTAYLPNTQDYLSWCQFVEFEQYRDSKLMWVIWNGEHIIESSRPVLTENNNIEYTFDWRKRKTLQEMLSITRTL